MNETDGGFDRLDLPDLSAEVLDVRERYAVEGPLVHLDPDEPLEAAVHAGLRADPSYADRLQAGWSALLSAAGGQGEDLVRVFRPLGPVPAGPDWPSWARYVSGLVPRIAAGGPEFPPHRGAPGGQPMAFAAGQFPDTATANRVATDVLRGHEREFRQWCADPQGRPRLHLYADLRRPTGVREGQLLTGCVVLMRRDADGRPYIATSYPEQTLSPGPRRRHPDLSTLLGGFFGQDLHELDRTAWDAERRFAEEASEAVRARVAGQLGALVAGHARDFDDAALRAEVTALGAYLLPADLHRWLRGLARRLTELW